MNIKYRYMVDSVPYKNKPNVEEIAKIQTRLRDSSCLKELSIEELLEFVCKGYSIVLGEFNNGIKDSNFISSGTIGLDIDEPTKTIDIIVDDLRQFGINVNAYYETFSSTKDKPRYRLLIKLDRLVDNVELMKSLIKTIINSSDQFDEACKNPSRVFYGTDGSIHEIKLIDSNIETNVDDILRLSAKTVVEDSSKEYSDDISLIKMISSYNLFEYVKNESSEYTISGDIGRFKKCPICGHEDCFRVYLSTNTYYCFGSNGSSGGNIINYLQATKKISKYDAIDYFKYDLLKQPRDEGKNLIDKCRKKDYQLINNQLSKYDLSLNIPKELPWLSYKEEQRHVYRKLIRTELAAYLRKAVRFLYIKTSSNNKVLKLIYRNGKYNFIGENEQKGIIKSFIPEDIQKSSDYQEVYNLLLTDPNYISIDMLNSDWNIINFQNGLYYIDEDELKLHSPNCYSSRQIPCKFDKNAQPTEHYYVDNFFKELSCNNKDIEDLLWTITGFAISNYPGYLFKAGFFLIGPGNCGKSVFKALENDLVGPENCSSVDFKDLEKPFNRIQLLGKRIAGSNDISSMKISSLDYFKQLTGGDYINDSYKGMDAIDFRYDGLVIMAGNRMPVFSGDRGVWVYDRMIIIPCENVISKEKQDKLLLEHLKEEYPYIVAKSIKYLKKVIDNDFKLDIPDICVKAKERYMVDNNSILTFKKEYLIERTEKYIHDPWTCGKIYEFYKQWYIDNHRDRYYENSHEFRETMGGKDAIIKTNGGKEYYTDWTLNEKAIREISDKYFTNNLSSTISNNQNNDYSLYEERD